MSSNLPTTEGPIFMNLGGRNRNMITEPFEEDEPEFPQYGEFKRQIEQIISTKHNQTCSDQTHTTKK